MLGCQPKAKQGKGIPRGARSDTRQILNESVAWGGEGPVLELQQRLGNSIEAKWGGEAHRRWSPMMVAFDW
jgi:hypothetical protein